MDELLRIKESYFRAGKKNIGQVLAKIHSLLDSNPEFQNPYLQQALDLEHNNLLTIDSISSLHDSIQREVDSKETLIKQQQALIKQHNNKIRNVGRKKVIFKILEMYQDYIHSILLNINNDPQFNSVIHSFAVELSVKFLYMFEYLDDLVETLSESTDIDSYLDRPLPPDVESKIVCEMDKYLIKLDLNVPKDTVSLNVVLDAIKSSDLAPGFLHNFKQFVNDSSHSNDKYINALPNHIKNLIKYYTIKFYSIEKLDVADIDKESVDYIDYFLMTRDFLGLEDSIKTNNALQEINSERFHWGRYNAQQESIENNYQFVKALAMASFMIFRDVKQSRYMSTIEELSDPNELSFISKLYTKEIKVFLDNDNAKKALLIDLNKRYPNLMTEINEGLLSSEFDSFIKKLNIDEIKYLFNEITTNPNSNSICDLIRYAINFKNKLSNYNSLTFNDAKYARINQLFKLLSDTQDLTYVGAQLRNWLDSINLHELTSEELAELNKIDPNFVFSQLDYRSQVIYKKCQELNIQYRYYYRRFTNAQLELLFDMYKYTGIDIPLAAVALTNVEIARAFEKTKGTPLPLQVKMLSFELNNRINIELLKNINKTQTIEGLRDYIRAAASEQIIIYRNTGLNYVISTQLKECYYDADFETIKAIANFYNNDVEKMNKVPNYIILCSFDKLSVLLKQYGGDVDIICSLPAQQFVSYPNREIYVTPQQKAALLLNKRTTFERAVLESHYISMTRQKIIGAFPEFLSHNFNYDSLKPTIFSNLKYIKSHADEEDFVKIVELFCDKREVTNFTKEEQSFSEEIQTTPEIFRFVFDKVSSGDMTSNIEAKVSKMRSILKNLTRVYFIDVLSFLSKGLFYKRLEDLTEQDYKRISLLPDYLLKSDNDNMGNNLQTYLFEQELSTYQKKDGIKLLTPQEIELSYYKLKSYLAKPDEEGHLVSPTIPLEPLMYIDYNDICHLIQVYESLVEQGIKLEKIIILAMINYISTAEYKINVHTFGPQDFLALIVQGFTEQNTPKQGPKVA